MRGARGVADKVPRSDKLAVMGDFNAQVEKNIEV